MKTQWIALGLAACVAAPLAQSSNSPTPAPNADRGMVLFSAYCASCHGEAGRGDGPVAPRLARDFNVKPTDFSQPAWQAGRSDQQLLRIVQSGGRVVHRTAFMPAWGATLNPQQTRDMVAFLRELSKPAATGYKPAAMPGIQQTLELGRVLYTTHCLACHGLRGKGDGPRLEAAREDGFRFSMTDFSKPDGLRQRSDEEIAEFAGSGVYHGHVPMSPEENPWWHRPLDKAEVQAVTLYLRCLPLR